MLSRFRHILVPVEIGSATNTAVEIASELAAEKKARITLLHVIQAIGDDDPPDDETQRFYSHLQRRVDRDLEQTAAELRETGIATSVCIPVGDRLQEIAEFVRQSDVDLIIMSSHRVDPENLTASWGTLSYRVSVVCDAPILLVK